MATESVDRQRLRAHERNQRLAQRTARWARLRLALTVLFVVTGCAVAVALRSLAISFPFFGMAALFLILYLDANGQTREIRRRNWKTLLPASSLGAPPTETPAHDPRSTQAPQ